MRLELDSTSQAAILDQAADFTLLLDRDGRIEQVAVASDELAGSVDSSWKGRSWLETTDLKGRERLERLIGEAVGRPGRVALGDVTHPLPDGILT